MLEVTRQIDCVILLRIPRTLLCLHQSFLILWRQLGLFEADRQLVDLAREPERYLLVLIIHRRAGIRSDVESFVPGQRQRNGALQRLRRDHLSVDLERSGARSPDAADTVEHEGSEPEPIIFEVVLERMFTCGKRLRALPTHALQIEQVPKKHRLAFQQIQSIPAEAPAVGDDHALGATLRHVDIRLDRI